MFQFFSKKSPSIVAGNVDLPNANFNYQTMSHLEIIEQRMARFTSALAALQTIDRNIVLGAAIGSGSYLGSYLFPLVLVSIAGSFFAGYNCALRGQVYTQYRKALEDLIDVYQWSMGKDTGNHWYKLGVSTLQELISTLGPWVSSNTIHTWAGEDIKPRMISLSNRRQDISPEFEKRLTELAGGTQAASLSFRLYGEHGMDNLMEILRENVSSQVTDVARKLFVSKSA